VLDIEAKSRFVKALVKTSMMIALLQLVLSVIAALATEMSRITVSA
jgi:hypothetical protein